MSEPRSVPAPSPDEVPHQVFLTPPPELDQWHPPVGYDGKPTDPNLTALAQGMRELLDTFTAANAPSEVTAAAAAKVAEATALLAPFEASEWDQLAGRRLDIPGRAQVLAPPYYVDEWSEHHVRARVRFSRFWLGGNGAVHGGALCLTFDDVLGRLANVAGRSVARTAYLNVAYRGIAPIDEELTLVGEIVREEGRKRFLSGKVFFGERLCAEADALFVALLRGQQ